MRKHITFLLLIFSFCSSELIAQNFELKIEGETNIETEIINAIDYNRNHLDYNSIIAEADTLQQKIIKAGYLESEKAAAEKINDSLFLFNFKLNNKYETIHIYYDASKISKKNIDLVTPNSFDSYFSIPFIDIERVLTFINTKITNEGFPFSKIKLSEIKVKDKKTLVANLFISEGETKRGLDKIIIKGYEKFPQSYLNRYLKIKPSTTFNIEAIKNKIKALDNLRFANQIKPPEVLFSADTTALYLYLEKRQSNSFDGFLGFSTNEDTNKLDFNGYLDLELNNNLNYGESFALRYKSNENEEKNFDVKINLPYLFGSPIGSELELAIFKKDSTFTTVNQKAKLFYQLNSKNRIYIGIDNTQSNNLLDETITSSVNDYNSNFYTSRYEYENRNNYNRLFQLKTLAQIEFGFGNRKANANNTQQLRFLLNAHHIFNLNNKNSIYIRVNGMIISSDDYLENELIRFGGINSIRGFAENSLLATRYASFNSEYRYQLSSSIYVHSIIDYASLENKIALQKENLYGYGLGFGIITKAGLLKFNFANGKTKNQTFKFSNSKIHLSLTTIF